MNILSIQSHVAYGHVGNSAAVFALQRIGCEVWPVHTVEFSNHPGYGQWRGRVLEAELIRDVVTGIEERGALVRCDGVLSGYAGSREAGAAILDAVARVKAANPAARYCCDPVIGDVGPGIYVGPGIPELVRDFAVPVADVITPNHFELDFLSGTATTTLAGVLAAVDGLHARGPRTILVTSLHIDDTPRDAVDLIASDGDARLRLRTPKLSGTFNGAGDAIAALFFAHRLRKQPLGEALSRAASAMFGVIRRSAEAASRELLLVEAQDELVAPSRIFPAEPIMR